jgi:CheY-like chemotaxis protein
MKFIETATAQTCPQNSKTTSKRFTPLNRSTRKKLSGVPSDGGSRHYFESAHQICKPRIQVADSEKPLVLHVDDDVDLVDAVTSRLGASGFRVASAIDGMSGIQSAMIFPVRAIILDYDMPNGRGDTVIDLLKANSKTQDIPIVVLTAVHKKGLKRELLNKGANAFMTKPFNYLDLEQTIKGLIS